MSQGPTRARGEDRRPGTLRIGSIAGVGVFVQASWVLVALLIAVVFAPRIENEVGGLGGLAYVAGLMFAVLLYLSVLLHELSHALAAKAFALPVRSVTLHFLGGVTEIEGEPQTPWREFVVSVVGPLTSLAVGAVAWGVGFLVPDGLVGFFLNGLALANLIVGVLNLVPGLPLDGGRVLRAAVWWATKRPHIATVVAGWAGRGVALLALASPLLLAVLTRAQPEVIDYVLAAVIGAFLWEGASQALRGAQVRRRLPALQARSLARRAIGVPHDLPLAEALRRLHAEQGGAIVVVGGDDRPTGIVSEAAATATPEPRKPWVTCGSLARPLEPGLVLDAGLGGEALVRALQQTPASEYLLVEPDDSILGVLSTADVDAVFANA